MHGHKKEAFPISVSMQNDKPEGNQEGTGNAQQFPMVTNTGMGPSTAKPSMVQPETCERFGPWMLAPRRMRRGQNNVENRRSRIPASEGEGVRAQRARTGSRFEVLEGEDDRLDTIREERIEEQVQVMGGTEHNKKERRSNVITSERQINNDKRTKVTSRTSALLVHAGRNLELLNKEKRLPRRAVGEAEHVVVRGLKHGETIRQMVKYNDEIMFVPETNEENMPEHFQDPPNQDKGSFDEDMEDDEESPMGSGLPSPSAMRLS